MSGYHAYYPGFASHPLNCTGQVAKFMNLDLMPHNDSGGDYYLDLFQRFHVLRTMESYPGLASHPLNYSGQVPKFHECSSYALNDSVGGSPCKSPPELPRVVAQIY